MEWNGHYGGWSVYNGAYLKGLTLLSPEELETGITSSLRNFGQWHGNFGRQETKTYITQASCSPSNISGAKLQENFSKVYIFYLKLTSTGSKGHCQNYYKKFQPLLTAMVTDCPSYLCMGKAKTCGAASNKSQKILQEFLGLPAN